MFVEQKSFFKNVEEVEEPCKLERIAKATVRMKSSPSLMKMSQILKTNAKGKLYE